MGRICQMYNGTVGCRSEIIIQLKLSIFYTPSRLNFIFNIVYKLVMSRKHQYHQYHQALLPGESYHLFTCAVGREKLFISKENYIFFLRKLKAHTAAICCLFCYSLLPNHFHLFVRIHSEEMIIRYFEQVKKVKYDSSKHDLSDFIMERFSNLLNSYTKAINKRYLRKGALFIDYLKRSRVNGDEHFTSIVWYIHKNAVHHKITNTIGDWEHDSYNSILSQAPTSLMREEVLAWFGGLDGFIRFHEQKIYPKIEMIDL
jgi:putative transposase